MTISDEQWHKDNLKIIEEKELEKSKRKQQNEYMYELERGMDRLERELKECKENQPNLPSNQLKLFYWKFVESINTSYPHVYFALARDKNHAIDLVRLQLDFSDRQKEKESNFILKSIALNEPEIIETEKGVLILSKC